jgi:16S rRNA (guanine527-N7)-methyltransferase
MMETQPELERRLEGGGVDDPALRAALARYALLVFEANRRFNVTGAKSAEELVAHLLDSLSVVPFVRHPYVDVGSGAGFPAIPVALKTRVPVTLIEATVKKARLLESILAELGVEGRVIAERAEIAGRDPALRDRFASGTARAVASAPAVAELVLPFVEPGGTALLQRGVLPAAERRALEDASLVLGAHIESEEPAGENRRILVLRKTGATPARFPRRPGIPAKRPLCLEGA